MCIEWTEVKVHEVRMLKVPCGGFLAFKVSHQNTSCVCQTNVLNAFPCS